MRFQRDELVHETFPDRLVHYQRVPEKNDVENGNRRWCNRSFLLADLNADFGNDLIHLSVPQLEIPKVEDFWVSKWSTRKSRICSTCNFVLILRRSPPQSSGLEESRWGIIHGTPWSQRARSKGFNEEPRSTQFPAQSGSQRADLCLLWKVCAVTQSGRTPEEIASAWGPSQRWVTRRGRQAQSRGKLHNLSPFGMGSCDRAATWIASDRLCTTVLHAQRGTEWVAQHKRKSVPAFFTASLLPSSFFPFFLSWRAILNLPPIHPQHLLSSRGHFPHAHQCRHKYVRHLYTHWTSIQRVPLHLRWTPRAWDGVRGTRGTSCPCWSTINLSSSTHVVQASSYLPHLGFKLKSNRKNAPITLWAALIRSWSRTIWVLLCFETVRRDARLCNRWDRICITVPPRRSSCSRASIALVKSCPHRVWSHRFALGTAFNHCHRSSCSLSCHSRPCR